MSWVVLLYLSQLCNQLPPRPPSKPPSLALELVQYNRGMLHDNVALNVTAAAGLL